MICKEISFRFDLIDQPEDKGYFEITFHVEEGELIEDKPCLLRIAYWFRNNNDDLMFSTLAHAHYTGLFTMGDAFDILSKVYKK